MKILSKDEILSANDIYTELIEVPEWGGSVYVKTFTGAERDRLEAHVMRFGVNGKPASANLENMRALVASLGICDESGNTIFTAKDIPALARKSAAALDRVVAKIQSLAGMTPADVESLVGDLKNDQPADLHLG